MNSKQATQYHQRFERVLLHIDQHLYEPLTLEELSDIAHFSKYHFLRQFAVYMGMSLFSYIRLIRLKRASYRLAINLDEKIIDIALDAGFENPESFSRAFKQTFSQTPSQFRAHPQWQPWNEKYQLPITHRNEEMNVNIVYFDAVPVGILEHRASPTLVDDSVMKLIEWRKTSGLSPIETSNMYGLAYDDPLTTAPDQFRFDLCTSVTQDIPANPQGVKNGIIPAGRCAVTTHRGAHHNLSATAQALYRDWLPASGEELRDFPLFFHYCNLMPGVEEHELVTDVYLPLK